MSQIHIRYEAAAQRVSLAALAGLPWTKIRAPPVPSFGGGERPVVRDGDARWVRLVLTGMASLGELGDVRAGLIEAPVASVASVLSILRPILAAASEVDPVWGAADLAFEAFRAVATETDLANVVERLTAARSALRGDGAGDDSVAHQVTDFVGLAHELYVDSPLVPDPTDREFLAIGYVRERYLGRFPARLPPPEAAVKEALRRWANARGAGNRAEVTRWEALHRLFRAMHLKVSSAKTLQKQYSRRASSAKTWVLQRAKERARAKRAASARQKRPARKVRDVAAK